MKFIKNDLTTIEVSYTKWVSYKVMNALIVAAFFQFIFIFTVFVFFDHGVIFSEPNKGIAIVELILSVLLIPAVIWRLKQ